jgi:hypothetical protein
MAPNSLDPAFGIIEYTSAWGTHKQTVCTTDWNAGIGTNGYGGYVGNDGSTPNDALDMWTDLCNALAAFALASLEFNLVTIYTQASPTALPLPRRIVPLGIVGTNTATTQAKAVQQTWNMRSTIFGRGKIVLLDCPVGSNFDKILAGSFGGPDAALVGELTDLTKAWLFRDSSPPAAAISKTVTLNDKLRKEYGMA